MPTYFDPVTLENTEINETTTLYLIKIKENSFGIKGISSNISTLASDPTTHATQYWLVSAQKLLENELGKTMFLNDQLINDAISLNQIVEVFGFDPNEIPATNFNAVVGEQLIQDWQNHTTEDWFQNPVENAPDLSHPNLGSNHFTFFNNSPTTVTLSPSLEALGFTNQLLNSWKPSPFNPRDGFTNDHIELLMFLVNEQTLNPQQAIEEIHQLNWLQLTIFKKLYDKGLRGNHLRELEFFIEDSIPGNDFFNEIYVALENSVVKDNMSITEALNFVKEMNLEQFREYTVW